MPAAGGVPKRLTWHPSPDVVLGWSPDGKKIIFSSPRESYVISCARTADGLLSGSAKSDGICPDGQTQPTSSPG